MFLIPLSYNNNYIDESDESLDNPLPNSQMFIILLKLRSNVKDESDESLDNPLPNS